MAGYCIKLRIHSCRDKLEDILNQIFNELFSNCEKEYIVDGIDRLESTHDGLFIMFDYYGDLSICEDIIVNLSKHFNIGILMSIHDWICPDSYLNYYFYDGVLVYKYENQPLEYSGDEESDARIEDLIDRIKTVANEKAKTSSDERDLMLEMNIYPSIISDGEDDIPF